MEKITNKVQSDLLLNVKDINKFKSSNARTKVEQKALDIESSIEAYNKNYIKALEAPVPDIGLHYNEVLLRACPAEIKSKGGLIFSIGDNDFNIANKLNKMSDAVDQVQEILLVGDLITDREKEAGIRPGRMVKFKLDRFRNLSDTHKPGMIETEYTIPIENINGVKYILIDKRDILYTMDKK